MCKHLDTIAPLVKPLFHQRLCTHMSPRPTWHPCPPVTEWHVLHPLKSFFLFSVIGRCAPQGGAVCYSRRSNGSPWELCIKHVAQQSHRGALQYVRMYLGCLPLPHGRPLWRHHQSSQSGVTVMNLLWWVFVILGPFCCRCSEKQRN